MSKYKEDLICGICYRSNVRDGAKFNTVSNKVLAKLKVDKLCIPCKEEKQAEAIKQIKIDEANKNLMFGKSIKAYKRALLSNQ